MHQEGRNALALKHAVERGLPLAAAVAAQPLVSNAWTRMTVTRTELQIDFVLNRWPDAVLQAAGFRPWGDYTWTIEIAEKGD